MSLNTFGRCLVAGALVAFAACGDALVPTGFEGDPVFQYESFLIIGAPPSDATRPVYALFWHTDGYDTLSWDEMVEQPGTRRGLTGAEVLTFNLFEHPADHLLSQSEEGGQFGLATIVAYDDQDDNGRFDTGEPMLAHGGQGLLYVPRALDADTSPTGRPLPQGYHRVDVPLSCEPVRLGTEPCFVPIGAACEGDGDCGDGTCLSRVYAAGVGHCVLRDQGDCKPEGAALTYELVETIEMPDAVDFVWFEACETHAQCDPQTARYCDVALGACLPDQGLNLQMGRLLREGPCSPLIELAREQLGEVCEDEDEKCEDEKCEDEKCEDEK